MTIQFQCEHCDQPLQVPQMQAGDPIRCPNCRHVGVAPQATELKKEIEKPTTNPFIREQEVTEVIRRGKTNNATVGVDRRRVAFSRASIYGFGTLLLCVSTASFFLGMLSGGAPVTNQDSAGLAQLDEVTIRGRVTYPQSDDPEAPDVGAVLLLVPTDWTPGEKMDYETIEPGTDAIDYTAGSVLDLQQGGGVVTHTGSDGRFEFQAPTNRTFYMVILSNNVVRPDSPRSEHVTTLNRVMTDAKFWFADHQYRWTRETFDRHRDIRVYLKSE
ncbi:MAG: hypothetical protein MK006_10490 [Pirellulales bacterium]|nr:hypothetical protein [Pirellulales bacterium]